MPTNEHVCAADAPTQKYNVTHHKSWGKEQGEEAHPQPASLLVFVARVPIIWLLGFFLVKEATVKQYLNGPESSFLDI